MSIFVIDEHPLMREALVTLLARTGHPAIGLGRLAAATEAAQAHGTPEVICVETAQATWTAHRPYASCTASSRAQPSLC